jgi:aminoglycoside phosphotransferase (APT) family kinase protein
MEDPHAMPERLGAYLTMRDGRRTATVVQYDPMIGGYSRVMARACVEWSDGIIDTFVLRGDPPAGRSLIETSRDAEWALLDTLQTAGAVRMPAPLHYDDTGEHLGTKCIVLEFVEGESMQAALNALSTEQTGSDAPVDYGGHPTLLADMAAHIHTIDPALLAGVMPVPTDWETYIDSLINRFREFDAANVESNPVLRYTAAWLQANKPPPLPLTVVHSDFQPANIMIGVDGSTSMVDWELCHIGDPREDLGYYNVYAMALGPNLFMADPMGFLARYREQTGFSEEAVNPSTMAYFSSLAAITVYGQILMGAAAMSVGENSGLMTTYTLNALTIGHNNFLAGCTVPGAETGTN